MILQGTLQVLNSSVNGLKWAVKLFARHSQTYLNNLVHSSSSFFLYVWGPSGLGGGGCEGEFLGIGFVEVSGGGFCLVTSNNCFLARFTSKYFTAGVDDFDGVLAFIGGTETGGE